MDWNRDGKVDAHDTVLYHSVITSDYKSESKVSSPVNGNCCSGLYKSRSNQIPNQNIDSESVGWIIVVILVALLLCLFS